jgi:hypothetical protein
LSPLLFGLSKTRFEFAVSSLEIAQFIFEYAVFGVILIDTIFQQADFTSHVFNIEFVVGALVTSAESESPDEHERQDEPAVGGAKVVAETETSHRNPAGDGSSVRAYGWGLAKWQGSRQGESQPWGQSPGNLGDLEKEGDVGLRGIRQEFRKNGVCGHVEWGSMPIAKWD